jgi:hypothetical protein
MGFCTVGDSAKDMAKTASDLYASAKGGDPNAIIDAANAIDAINRNSSCDGHDKFVKDAYSNLSGPLASDAVLGQGKRQGYPRFDETVLVSEIQFPALDFGVHSAKK